MCDGLALFLLIGAAVATYGSAAEIAPVPGATAGVEAWQIPLTSDPLLKLQLGEARILANIGMGALARKELPYAEKYLTKSLSAFREALGDECLVCAQLLNALGCVYSIQGDYLKAERSLLQALEISKKVAGSSHLTYLSTLNTLGGLYLQKQDFAKARPILQQVVDGYKRTVGEDHPFYAASVANLGFLHLSAGDLDRAEPRLQEALQHYRQCWGNFHPAVVNSLVLLADLYKEKGDLDASEQALKEALAIEEKLPQLNGLSKVKTLQRYAAVLRAMDRDDEARALEEQAEQAAENP